MMQCYDDHFVQKLHARSLQFKTNFVCICDEDVIKSAFTKCKSVLLCYSINLRRCTGDGVFPMFHLKPGGGGREEEEGEGDGMQIKEVSKYVQSRVFFGIRIPENGSLQKYLDSGCFSRVTNVRQNPLKWIQVYLFLKKKNLSAPRAWGKGDS